LTPNVSSGHLIAEGPHEKARLENKRFKDLRSCPAQNGIETLSGRVRVGGKALRNSYQEKDEINQGAAITYLLERSPVQPTE
jgi:hypothetical protein